MSDTTIEKVVGRRVWDSRGRPAVEAEVALRDGARGRAIAPAGASTGTGEALDLRDGGQRFGGYGVERAVAHVNEELATLLRGLDASDQATVDEKMIAADGTADKSRLGGNALIAVSLAAAHAAAAAAGQPLYVYLGGPDARRLPLPEIQIFGGGAHAGRRLSVQDFMVVALSAKSFDEALAMTAEIYHAAGRLMATRGKLQGVADEGGYWPAFDSTEEALETLVSAIERAGFVPGEEVGISLDIAASQFYRNERYQLDNRSFGTDEFCQLLLTWIDRYKIISIEDPFAESDAEGFRRLTSAVGRRVQVIGDDFLVTNADRARRAVADGTCNAMLIKPNQAGTLTEAKAALEAARAAGWGTIVSARSGETEDTSIVHLAVGWGAGQLKVGSFSRSERMAKWNEALRIEEALGSRAVFAGRAALPAGEA